MKNNYLFAYRSCNKISPLLLVLFGMLLSYQVQANTLIISRHIYQNKVLVERLESTNTGVGFIPGISRVRWYVNEVYVGTDENSDIAMPNNIFRIFDRELSCRHCPPNSRVFVRAEISHYYWSLTYRHHETVRLTSFAQLASYLPVTNLQASYGTFKNKVELTWNTNELFNRHRYVISKNGRRISDSLPEGTTTFTEFLAPGSPRAHYSVIAVVNRDVSHSLPVVGRTFNFNLRASTDVENGIVLTWNNTSATHQAAGIRVEWRNRANEWEQVWETNNNQATSITMRDPAHHELIPGHTYEYRVRVLPINTSDVVGYVSGKSIPNGRISGCVRTRLPGNTPVSGIRVQAKMSKLDGIALPADTTPTYVTTTNHEGFFVFNNMYYYRDAHFIITPIADKRLFYPANRTVNLTLAEFKGTANFTDTSSFTIAGNISNGWCPVAGVHIIVGSDTLGITNSFGNYSITVSTAGAYTIIPRLAGREFYPSRRTVNVLANNIEGINFIDTTSHLVRGRLQASCNTPIGRGTIRFFGPDKTSPCFDQRIDTDIHGYFAIWLPAQKYYYNLVNFTSDDPAQLNSADVLALFSIPRLLDLSEYNTDIFKGDTVAFDLTYRTPPILQMSNIGYATTCLGPTIPLVKRYEPLEISFFAFDDFQDNQCPAADGIIIIRENVSSNGMEVNIDTIFYKKGEPITYTLIPGTPNLNEAQGFKKFFEATLIRDGQSSETIYREIIVLGDTPREQNFLTVSPDIPFHILHDPPGDGSYSFLEANQSITSSFSQSFLVEETDDTFVRAQLGPSVSVETGFLGIAGASVQIDTQLDITRALGFGSSGLTDWGTTFTTTVSEFFSTSDAFNFIGGAGDVYIGGALNLVYGISDILTYDFRNCKLEKSQTLFMQPKSMASTFIYTESHITDFIIPELKSIAEYYRSKNNWSSAEFFLNQMRVWEQVVETNHKNIEDAEHVEIISFSGGTSYTKTLTTSRTETKTIDWNVYVDLSVAVETGLSIGGVGIYGGVAISSRSTWGGVVVDGTEQTNTVGFHLSDDDFGDAYLVQVLNNYIYGTPAFRLISGQSSCPHEPGTLPREGVQLSVMGHKNTQHVPEAEDAVFVLQLSNTSQSNEKMVYDLIFDHTSNPGGAEMTIGGSPIIGGIPYSYIIPAGGQTLATITVSKGPIHDTYNGLRFILRSQCDDNIYEEVLLNATFYREYNLNMFVNGNGTTNITGRQVFREGSVVGLFAMPNMGYEFQKWVVGTTQYFTQVLAVTMDRNKAATAHFVRTTEPQFTVTVSRNGNGTTFPDPNTYVVNRNALFTISANPEMHNAFVKWTINGKEVTDQLTEIIITENTTIVAEFVSTHTVSIQTVGRGFVTPDIATHVLKYGSELSLYASPQLGYVFDRWVVGNTELLNQHASITVDRSLTATAHFVPTNAIQHILGIANSSGGTTIPPAGSYLFTDGSVVNVTAIPNTGKVFQKWIINGVENTSNPANISVTGGVNVEAFFIDDLAASSPNIVMDNEITVFPNPANEMVTVKFGSEKVNRIEIINSLGHSVILKQVNNARNSETFDISTLQPGIYFIKIETANGNIVKRLMKE